MSTKRAVTLFLRPAIRTPYSRMAAKAPRSNGQRVSFSDVRGADDGFLRLGGLVIGFARQVRNVNKTGSHFISAASHTDAIFEDGREGSAVERPESLFFGQCAKPASILRNDGIVHSHFFVKLDGHLENLAKVFLVIVEQFVHFAVADQDDLDVDLDGFRLHSTATEGIEHFERLNLKPIVIQGALQGTPYSRLGNGLQ